MKNANGEPKPKLSLLLVLTLQLALLISIFLNFTIAGQVLGIVYLTVIPGFIILKLLGADKFDTIEKVLFSIGFSLAFMMLLGFFVNQFSSLIGLSKPLSNVPMLGAITCFVVTGTIICYSRDAPRVSLSLSKVELKSLLFFILPVLSVVGAVTVAVNGANTLLLLTVALVATAIGISIISNKIVPSKYYAIIIFSIALTMVSYMSFSTIYIQGYDIHAEYDVFLDTQENAYWDTQSVDVLGVGRLGSMLSITILPTIYSNILNMDPTWVLKIIFPILLAFIPLGVFKLCQPIWGNKTAFVSALLVIVQATFYVEILGLCREIVAELFFILLLIVLFRKKVHSSRTENFCFILFSFGMVVSHYGISVIFFFIMVGVWFLIRLNGQMAGKITLARILLLSVLMFSWYIFAGSGTTMQSIMQFGNFIVTQLSDFFNIYSRGDEVALGLGVGVFETAQSNWQVVGRFFAYATQLFILIGFVSLLIKHNRIKLGREYFFFLLLGIVLLGMTIVLPGFAKTLAMTRWYHIALLIISPFLALGCDECVSLLIRKNEITRKHLSSILIVAVLVPYFLFQTNFVYEMAGVKSWSVPLSRYRMDNSLLYGWTGYVNEQSVVSSQWLTQNVNVTQLSYGLYADTGSFFVLRSYGRAHEFSHWSNLSRFDSGNILYLSSLAVVHGVILHPYTFNPEWNTSDLEPQLESMDKVYSNGGSEVWIYPN